MEINELRELGHFAVAQKQDTSSFSIRNSWPLDINPYVKERAPERLSYTTTNWWESNYNF